ncbi:hypothetical protein EV653_5234 [Kribbella pratensis]|jgi:hypothetical protein|uniref:Uncharacterized protein n=1 Tax=Kribbella pratensis TaxID=2512112 RepID=A0A4V3GG86_9ACTN|nr:hypothetical protein EV653_5234 [Kribbella pratensis]
MTTLSTRYHQSTRLSDPGLSLPESLRDSLQHIRLLQNKRRTLADAQVGAELQFLAALRRECNTGHTTWRELRHAYAALDAGRVRGMEARWMDAIGISPEKVVANAKREATRARGVRKRR